MKRTKTVHADLCWRALLRGKDAAAALAVVVLAATAAVLMTILLLLLLLRISTEVSQAVVTF